MTSVLQIMPGSRGPTASKEQDESSPVAATATDLDALETSLDELNVDLPDVFSVTLEQVVQCNSEQEYNTLPPLMAGSVDPGSLLQKPLPASTDLDAEQWLASMQSQREVQVATREAGAIAQGEAALPKPVLPNTALSSQPNLDKSQWVKGNPQVKPVQLDLPVEKLLPRALSDVANTATTGTAASELTLTPTVTLNASGDTIATAIASESKPDAISHTLKLPNNDAKWGEKILHALRDTVEVQVQQRVQNATIRLDPPELGSLEIFVSHESGRLSVHISSNQVEVSRLLQHTSERLRNDLITQNYVDVTVDINNQGQSDQRHSRQQSAWQAGRDPVIAGNAVDTVPDQEKVDQHSGILVTV